MTSFLKMECKRKINDTKNENLYEIRSVARGERLSNHYKYIETDTWNKFAPQPFEAIICSKRNKEFWKYSQKSISCAEYLTYRNKWKIVKQNKRKWLKKIMSNNIKSTYYIDLD